LRGSSKKFEHKLTKEKLLFRITEYATRCFFEAHFFYTKEGWNEVYFFLLQKRSKKKRQLCGKQKKEVWKTGQLRDVEF
jgi:hypothetical protein